MISLGLWVVTCVIGIIGLLILATICFTGFILVFGGLSRIMGVKDRTPNSKGV